MRDAKLKAADEEEEAERWSRCPTCGATPAGSMQQARLIAALTRAEEAIRRMAFRLGNTPGNHTAVRLWLALADEARDALHGDLVRSPWYTGGDGLS